jgi:predicted DsbA family dithiol-disulfide isomerase
MLGYAAVAQVEGDYERIGSVPNAHTAEKVLFEEYINFTCPHCNNFLQAAASMKEKYGKRLEIVYVPILFRGQSDAALRLFYVAQKAGKEKPVMDALFDATFRYGVNINDPAVINYLARSTGLGEAYERESNADWVNQKLRESAQKADQAGISATPTVVLQGALRVMPRGGIPAFVDNLDRILSQLLKQ